MKTPSTRRALALAAVLLATLAMGAFGPPRASAQTPAAPAPACQAPPCMTPLGSSQLQNLGQLKIEIAAYYQSGSYDAELRAIEVDAADYLDQRVKGGVTKPALVLDIDDTALSTFGYESTHDFGFDPVSWEAAAAAGFPAIAPTLALAKHAAAEGVAVIFVTGRRTPDGELTRKNLTGAGYPIDGLYLRPSDDRAASVVPFKAGARAAIESQGYTVLETIGDQWSDLAGGHAERAYKLPNPMYVLP